MRTKNPPIPGIYHANPKGFGFVTPDSPDGGGDWFVPRGHGLGAWDGDAVTFVPTDPARRACKVTAVTRRAHRTVTGTLHRHGGSYTLTPDDPRLTHPLLLTGRLRGVSPGCRAAASVVSYGAPQTPPMATLAQVFGPGGTLESAQAAILYNYEVTPQFPPEVEESAAALPQAVLASELPGRVDFRDQTVATVDSASAKDLDDAVSLTVDPQGRRVLGVHIADVSHYVRPQTPIDQEAFTRGTSVYYADHVAPMLPTALSNGVCSLNPQVERLTLSCLMTLDDAGQVVDYKLVQGVIRTTDRLNYHEVNQFLDGVIPDDGPLANAAPAAPALRRLVTGLDLLAAQRRKLRRLRGALELSSTECYFRFDDQGRVMDIEKRASGRGESLIEECMLLANETVSKHLCDNALPGVFRVHEKPSAEKFEALKRMVAPLGYALKDASGFQLQKLLDWAKDGPLEGAVSMMTLRSLMKARYDPQDLGHFGLAAEHYCHFTSPIRRYPDLVVHRVLTASLTGNARALKTLAAFTPQAARRSSDREVAAQNAEREIEKLYMAQFMSDKVGQTFPGAVTGLLRDRLFVGLENGVEGALPIQALPHDRWHYDESAQTLTGLDSGTVYSFGTPLEVVCAAADPSTGKIDFTLPGQSIPSGIFVQTNHKLDTGRGPRPCSRNGRRKYSIPRKRRRGKR